MPNSFVDHYFILVEVCEYVNTMVNLLDMLTFCTCLSFQLNMWRYGDITDDDAKEFGYPTK